MRFLLIVVLLSAFPIFAQKATVTGRCIDKRSKGLENVQIKVTADTNLIVYTNSLGIFEFSVNFNQQISLEMLVNDLTETKQIDVKNQTIIRVGDVKLGFIQEDEVKIQGVRTEP